MPRRPDPLERKPKPQPLTLPEAIMALAAGLREELHHVAQAIGQSPGTDSGSATKQDLLQLEERITMKLSEIKAQVAAAATRSTEAFAELGTRIADLQQQIADLQAGNTDPEVTDEEFTANLATLKTNIDALADIVPTPEVPPPAE